MAIGKKTGAMLACGVAGEQLGACVLDFLTIPNPLAALQGADASKRMSDTMATQVQSLGGGCPKCHHPSSVLHSDGGASPGHLHFA
jgi:hypothetical protein